MSSYDRAAATVGAGFVARSAATAVTTVGGFAATVLAVRALGAERYGAMAFGLAITALAAVGARVGLGGAVTREVAAARATSDDGAAVVEVARAAWGVVVPAALTAAVVTGLIAALTPLDTSVSGRGALGVGLAVLVVGVNVGALGTFVARGAGRMAGAELPQVAIVLSQVLGFGWLAAHDAGSGVAAAGVVLASAGVAGMAAGLATIGRALPGARATRISASASRALLRRAAPFAVAAVATQVIAQADVIALGLARGAGEVGSYDPLLRTVDRALLLAPALFLAGFVPAATALLARGDRAELGRLYASTSTLAYALAVAPLTLLAAFPREVVGALFPDVAADLAVVRVLLLGYAVHLVFGLNTGALIAAGDRPAIVRAYAVTLVGMFAAVLAWVPAFGAVGAAAATATSFLVMNLAVTRAVHRATGSHPFDRRYVRVVASSIAPIGVAAAVAAAVGHTTLAVAISVSALAWAAWLAAVWSGGLIRWSELRAYVTGGRR